MNLLNNANAGEKSKIKDRMLEIFGQAKLSEKEQQKIFEFFDFDKELQIELLEGLTYQDLCSKYYFRNPFRSFLDDQDGKISEYTDRCILFLDAVGLDSLSSVFHYEYIEHERVIAEADKEMAIHALSRRYSPEMVQAKLLPLAIGDFMSEGCEPSLIDVAKNNPKDIFLAAKYCYAEKELYMKVKLYAITIAYANESCSKEIEEAIAYIKQYAEKIDFSSTEGICQFVMYGLFMAKFHDTSIINMLMEKIENCEDKFMLGVLHRAPREEIEKVIENLFEFIDFDKNPSLVGKCIKTILSDSWRNEKENYTLGLEKFAQKYPKSFIEVMYSIDVIRNTYSKGRNAYCCTYYLSMYEILQRVNPQAIQEHNLDYNKDILNLVIETEKEYIRKSSKKHTEMIINYLKGEIPLLDLEPYFGEIAKGKYTPYPKNDMILVEALKENLEFKKRYVAFMSMQHPDQINYVRHYVNDKYTRAENASEVAEILLEEKVPLLYRFQTYECINGDSTSNDDMEEALCKIMARFVEENDTAYEEYCANGEVFLRKLYLRYLAETNNESHKNNDKIFARCKDASKDVRRVAIEIISKNKEYEKDVLELLNAKKQSDREVALEILVAWGAENYSEILEKAAESEKSAKLTEKMYRILEKVIEAEEAESLEKSPQEIVDAMHKGSRNKKVLWLYETPNRTVHFKDGSEADEKYMQAILLCYANMTTLGINKKANILANELNEKELEEFALDTFSKWIDMGAEAKKKWILYFTALHGGFEVIEVFLRYVKQWAELARGAIAAEAIKAMALIGSSDALMQIDNIAHKFKHKQVKNAAIQALDFAADELSITTEELGDRIVPDLGFDANMERIFDYGPRKFKVYLTPSLELEIYDEDDKKRKSMPAPGKSDDEEKAKQASTEFKQMKKQMKDVISIQKLRLETAFIGDRRWNVDAWKELFVKNPVMHNFAMGLIWSAYEDGKLVQTFRYMEDGTFNTSEEEEYELSENCIIGLTHPIDLSEEELAAWKEQLSDYEIVQPFDQLERPVYRVNEDEKGTFDLKRFYGKKISGMTLLGRATKLGWYKGSVQDAGIFDTFYREDVTKRVKNENGEFTLIGNAAELHFSGMYVVVEDEEVKIENIRFYNPGTIVRGSYMYDEANDEKAIKLDEVSPRYFSEIVNQLETICKNLVE